MNLKDLDTKQKAAILDAFIDKVEGINKKCGSIMGTYQILDRLHDIAIEKGFVKCPCCGREG